MSELYFTNKRKYQIFEKIINEISEILDSQRLSTVSNIQEIGYSNYMLE